MIISKADYKTLCEIARALNNADEEDPDCYELYQALNTVIQNIK